MTASTITPGPWEEWPDYDEDGATGLTVIGTHDNPIVSTCPDTAAIAKVRGRR